MNKQRAITLVLTSAVILTATSWWASSREQAPALAPETSEAASADGDPERLAAARHDDPPAPPELEPPTTPPTSTSPSPLVRQRERLRDTAARLTARRDEAQATGAPEPTVQALDAHLARVEQRLAVLDVPADGSTTEPTASREASSAGSGS
jgi:type IV secretory pathway VirB10-like protein